MRNNLFLAFLLTTLIWGGCSNDFEVTAPWRDIPIVYGLLDVNDDVHYIRVEKAFLDPDQSALITAQIADSLYYTDAVVQLEKVNTGQVFTLNRVNGDDVGFPRDPGVFATSPNWLYRISGNQLDLQAGERIKFILDRGENLPLTTAEVVIQGPMVKRTPNGNNFDFLPNKETTLGWSASNEAKIFDAKLVINYAEFPKDNPSAVVEKSVEWVWTKGLTFSVPVNEYKIVKRGEEFFQIMAANIPNDPNFRRIFVDIDLEIVAGGEDLEKYINVALANSGITGSQELPSFTNLTEGQGVFSTISKLRSSGFLLTANTRDSLANGSITKHLNFQ